MKLRRSFSSHQLLFAAGFAAALGLSTPVSLFAQDKLVLRDGRTQQGKIVGYSNGNVQIQVGAGTIGIPAATVTSVVMAAPSEWTAAQAAYARKDYAKALEGTRAVTAKFKGLNTDWARQATGLLGDLYVALNKLPEAEAAYTDYQKLYGAAGGSLQSEVGLARIAVSKKDFDAARSKLEPVVSKALEEKAPPAPATAAIYGQALYLMGTVQEAQGQKKDALENYLLTVTLFYQDAAATAAAQQRADALRAEDKELTVR